MVSEPKKLVAVYFTRAEYQVLRAAIDRDGKSATDTVREAFLAAEDPQAVPVVHPPGCWDRPGHHQCAIARVREQEELIAAIWVYTAWRHVTEQLTSEERDLFADAVDASHQRANAAEPFLGLTPVVRWWQMEEIRAGR